jgi:hypothetical protein
MNVDLNTSLGANRLGAAGAKRLENGVVEQSAQLTRAGLGGPSLTVSSASSVAVDEAEAITEADLRRDDALGKMVMAAFDFQPPEMPKFI